MDPALVLKALVLGALEGLTEFLPISSTGHLIIAGDLLGFTGAQANTFKIFIQLGAILAVCWYYRRRLTAVAFGLPTDPRARRFSLNLAVAFVPAAGLGFLFHDKIQAYLFSPITVAIALIVGGIVILLIEWLVQHVRVETIDDMRWRDALKVGIAQCFALVPGVSRSASTIMGGVISGLSRRAAAEFSFFLAIPIMLAAAGFSLIDSWSFLRSEDISVFATGFLAAFVSALGAVNFLLNYLANHDFTLFAWYRIVFGLVVLAYYSL